MIGPVTAVTNGVTRTFSWRGRSTRSEYWFYLLFGWVVIVALVLTSELVKADAVKVVVGFVAWDVVFDVLGHSPPAARNGPQNRGCSSCACRSSTNSVAARQVARNRSTAT
ncbi:hypothetical protein [Amycolatopsis sp. lyj-109]|uniref:DUF805 domain-containing protein n=1 Tax=Amycolatopsis sp. lyj-109 TaxID=2789287 RepID=UPI00397A18ED